MIIRSKGLTGYKCAVGINKATNRPFIVMVGLLIPEGAKIVVPKTAPDYDVFFLGIGDPIDWDQSATSLFEWSSILNRGLMLNLDFADLFSPSCLKISLPTVYKVGSEVVADKLDPSEDDKCTNGIHFFMSMRDAERYLHSGWWPGEVVSIIRQRMKQYYGG